MFGYILPQKPELKIKEYKTYRAYYCGLCMQLKHSYGQASRLFLNYDLLLLALLYDGINGENCKYKKSVCIASPFEKKWICESSGGLRLAADILCILSYYKLRDNISDERFAKRCISHCGMPILRRAYKKAEANRPALAEKVKDLLYKQELTEKAHCSIPDEAADGTALIVAEAAKLCGSETIKADLHRFGLFLGKLIYLLDAADDFDDDIKYGRYNVFAEAGLCREDMLLQAKKQCRICAAELSKSYCRLPIAQNKSILDNIIYLGLPSVIEQLGTEKKRSFSDYERL